MKPSYTYSALAILVFALGVMFYNQIKHPRLACVDTHQIIRHTAEGLAKTTLDEEHLQRRLQTFKSDLNKSLRDFAKKEYVIVMPAHSVHGDVPDMTASFIAYHNRDAEDTVGSSKGGNQ